MIAAQRARPSSPASCRLNTGTPGSTIRPWTTPSSIGSCTVSTRSRSRANRCAANYRKNPESPIHSDRCSTLNPTDNDSAPTGHVQPKRAVTITEMRTVGDIGPVLQVEAVFVEHERDHAPQPLSGTLVSSSTRFWSSLRNSSGMAIIWLGSGGAALRTDAASTDT